MKSLLSLRSAWLMCLLFLLTVASAQNTASRVAETVLEAQRSSVKFNAVSPFQVAALPAADEQREMDKILSDYILLDYNPGGFTAEDAPEAIHLQLPGQDGEVLELNLLRVNVLTEDFTLLTSATGERPVNYQAAVHYRGMVKGDVRSSAAISFLPGEVMGAISYQESTLVLGLQGEKANRRHILYTENDLLETPEAECGTESTPFSESEQELLRQLARGELPAASRNGGCVRVYLELEYNLVTEKGGATGALNFITGLWNMVATLYQNDGVNTQVSQIFTWTTPDSYSTSSTSLALSSFRAARQTFNGDLAHLISRGAPSGGGVAYLNGLCNPNAAYAYSYIYSSYATVPTYSWSVNVLAHEMGHNLGSRHTHDCVWNGNNTPIDGCGPAAGYSSGCNGPLPANGGTIMSYCHLVSNVGINFNNGFGAQPGNLIRANVSAATCLTSCTTSGCPVLSFQAENVSCNGDTDGAITVSLVGGTAPFNYAWSNGATTAAISGLPVGFYSLTVTDAGNCSETLTVNITEPSVITASAGILEASPGDPGSIFLTINGGASPYAVNWSNGATSAFNDNLLAGTYGYTITDGNGCTATGSETVVDKFTNCTDNLLRITIQTDDFPRDNGFQLATDQLNILDGVENFSLFVPAGTLFSQTYCLPNGCYAWGMIDGQANGMCNLGGTFQGYYLIEDLTTGDTIAYNCDFVNWTRHDFCLGVDSLEIEVAATDVSCFGEQDGTATVTASGGSGTYTYAWSNGATTAAVTGLQPGTYSVTVTSGAYTETASVTIAQPPFLNINGMSSNAATTANNGIATVTSVNGGVPPYTYLWSDGQTGPQATNLVPATYSVTVTDATGCTDDASITVNFNGSTLDLNPSFTGITCFGDDDGSASVSPTGGTGSYQYLWTTGATTSSISNLAPGNYSVTVTSGSLTNFAHFTIPQTPLLTVSMSSTDNVRGTASGIAQASPAGGAGNYQYLWNTGYTFSTLINLTGGTYSVTITDGNGCQAFGSVVVNDVDPALSIQLTDTPTTCPGATDGTATVTATGGDGNYSYLWSNGATTAMATGLFPGPYGVTVTSNGQTVTGSGVITQPNSLSTLIAKNDATNGSNGDATVTAGGGTPPYTYAWSNGSTTATASGLAPGVYSITITDTNGCQASASITINDASGVIFERGQLSAVTDGWQTVSLTNTYLSPVVVATPVIESTGKDPVVTRIRNVGAQSFEVKVQRPSGATADSYTVEYLVVEEGVYNLASHGVKMEAVITGTTTTAARNRWSSSYREGRSYQQTYQSPVVLGQVMSHLDAGWSVFWACRTNSRQGEPTGSNLAAGKQVSEDSNTLRANETIGYIVVEAGNGTLGSLDFQAAVGSDIVRGQGNNNQGYTYASNFNVDGGILSVAGLDGGDGGWATFKSTPNGNAGFKLAFEEDQLRDTERNHTTEQVAYLVFGSAIATSPAPEESLVLPAEEEPTATMIATSDQVMVYPNPTRNLLNVSWVTTPAAEVQLIVTDLTGRRVSQQKVIAAADGKVSQRIDVSQLPHGLYLLQVTNGKEQQTRRFLVSE